MHSLNARTAITLDWKLHSGSPYPTEHPLVLSFMNEREKECNQELDETWIKYSRILENTLTENCDHFEKVLNNTH